MEDGVAEVLLPMARWGWAGGSLRETEKKEEACQADALSFVRSELSAAALCAF